MKKYIALQFLWVSLIAGADTSVPEQFQPLGAINPSLSVQTAATGLADVRNAKNVAEMDAGTDRSVAVAKATQAKLPGLVVNAKDFGAVGNGVADDTAQINNAIAAAAAKGGGIVFFPAGSYKISSTIRISSNGITLVGEGGATDGNVKFIGGMSEALASLSTKIVWGGPAGGTAMLFTPYPDDGTKPPLAGGGLLDLAIDGAGLAGVCLDLRTLRNARFENITVARCKSINVKIGTTTNNVVGGNKSLAFCQFRNFTATNATLGGTAKTMVLYGHITDGNAAINTFENFGLYSGTGVGSHVEIENSDSNTFIHGRWNGSLTLHASDTGTHSKGDAVARHNVFFNTQGHIIARAKSGTPHIQGSNGFDSYGNMAIGYSRENGIPYPTIEPHADFQFWATGLGLTNAEGGVQFGRAANVTLLAKTANQSIASGATSVVEWNAVSYDFMAAGNAKSSRIIAPPGAKWVRFTYGAEWAADSNAGRFIGIRVNGKTIISKDQRAGYSNSQATVTSQLFRVVPGDWYEMVVSQNTGKDLSLLGTTSTFMQAEWY